MLKNQSIMPIGAFLKSKMPIYPHFIKTIAQIDLTKLSVSIYINGDHIGNPPILIPIYYYIIVRLKVKV